MFVDLSIISKPSKIFSNGVHIHTYGFVLLLFQPKISPSRLNYYNPEEYN